MGYALKRRINQALSIIFSFKPKSSPSNKELLLLPMGIGDAVMFLDTLDYYIDDDSEIVILATKMTHTVFKYAKPKLKYTFVEFNPMKMDCEYRTFISILKQLGKYHYKRIIYPVRGFLTMDLLFSKLQAEEKICVDTNKAEKKSIKAKLREKFIQKTTVLRFDSNEMDLIRYARIASYTKKTIIQARLPCITPKSIIKDKYILISTGSSRKEKCWPIQRYADVIKFILEHSDYKIFFSGTEKDQLCVDSVIGNFNNERLVNLCGKTSIADLFDYIGNSSLVLGPDSGPIHLAIAMNIPSICIFGGWDYERIHPYKVDIEEKNRNLPALVTSGIKPCYKCNSLHGERGFNNPECKKMMAKGQPCQCIDEIHSDLVINEINKFFSDVAV